MEEEPKHCLWQEQDDYVSILLVMCISHQLYEVILTRPSQSFITPMGASAY